MMKRLVVRGLLFLIAFLLGTSCGKEPSSPPSPSMTTQSPARVPLRLANGLDGMAPFNMDLASRPDQLFQNGVTRFDQKQYGEAAPYFAAIVLKNPADSYAAHGVYMLGLCQQANGDLDGAAEAFRYLIEKHKDYGQERLAEAKFKMGDISEIQGRSVESKMFYREVIANHATTRWAEWARPHLAPVSGMGGPIRESRRKSPEAK